MTRPAHRLPAPEDGTLSQAIGELAAISDWAKSQRLDNIHYRVNWVLRVVSKHERGNAAPGASAERDRLIREARAGGRTLEDIGEEFGLSKQRVEQICKIDDQN